MIRPSFLALPRPIVTCIMRAVNLRETIANIHNGEYDGAPAFAVHLEEFGRENLTEKNFKAIVSATRRPVMLLHYRTPAVEGRPAPLTDDERAELLLSAIRGGAAAVDITADMFDPSALEFSQRPEAIVRQRRFIDSVHEMGGECVMSSHVLIPRTCGQVVDHIKAIEARGADFAKIVTRIDTEEEFLEALRTTMVLRREIGIPFIHLTVGRFARMHRYIAPALGNALTFCVWHYSKDYMSEQPPMKNMMTILNHYNWHIDLEEGKDCEI